MKKIKMALGWAADPDDTKYIIRRQMIVGGRRVTIYTAQRVTLEGAKSISKAFRTEIHTTTITRI